MARITKDPEVRKLELVNTAMDLFRENGYEQTSVSDIVKKVGVAQGTFYYYFQSKDGMVDAIIDYNLRNNLEKTVRSIMADDSTDATQKLQLIVEASVLMNNGEHSYAEYMGAKNAMLRQKFRARYNEIFVPLITEVVEQGIDKGVFHDSHPRETVELLMAMFGLLYDQIALSPCPADFERMQHTAEDIAAKALGAKEGCIRINLSKNRASGPADR